MLFYWLLAPGYCSLPRLDEQREQEGGGRADGGADEEGRLGVPGVPERPHQQGGREHRDAEGEVVEAVGRAALLGADEVGDERLLRALRQAEVDAVDEEERPGPGG